MVLIDGFPIDVAVSEDHSYEAEATSYPVESGSPMVDHIQNKPIVVTLEGIVSDTPLGRVAIARAASGNYVPGLIALPGLVPGEAETYGTTPEGVSPSSDAFTRLITIRNNREPVTIETSLEVFENMVLVGLTIPRSAANGEALHFTATFQQIKIVETERATLITASPSGKSVSKPSFRLSMTSLTDGRGKALYRRKLLSALPSQLPGAAIDLTNDRVQHKYYYADGSRVPDAKVRKAVSSSDAVQASYDQNGASYARNPKDYQPYTKTQIPSLPKGK